MMKKELEKGENLEELIPHVPREAGEKHPQEILRNVRSSKDLPPELKKRMANETIYLLRYE